MASRLLDRGAIHNRESASEGETVLRRTFSYNLQGLRRFLTITSSSPCEREYPVILYRCPSCDQGLAAREEEAGSNLRCPHCGQRLRVPAPAPNKTVPGKLDDPFNRPVLVEPEEPEELLEAEIIEESLPRQRTRRRDDDDEEEDQERRPRRRRSYPPCPNCGCTDPPRQTTKFGGTSIAMLIIGLFFWPLIIVAFLMQEKWDVCAECGEKFEQTGTGF
jgi:DNA-directed RNA polymerase subunit RPC12/RpoP